MSYIYPTVYICYFVADTSMGSANDQNRYIFGITGTVKEIIYPSKAIICFKYNGKERVDAT